MVGVKVLTLFIVFFIIFGSLVLAGKVKSVRKRTTVSAAAGTSQRRSFADWKKLSREALSLACNAVNIDSTGSPAVLSQCLFDHYNLLHITAPVVDPPVTTVDFTQHLSSAVNASLNSSSTFMVPSDLNTPSDLNIPSPQGFDIQTFLRQELGSYLSQELPRVLPQQRSTTMSSAFSHIVPPTIHNDVPTTFSPELPSMTRSIMTYQLRSRQNCHQ